MYIFQKEMMLTCLTVQSTDMQTSSHLSLCPNKMGRSRKHGTHSQIAGSRAPPQHFLTSVQCMTGHMHARKVTENTGQACAA